MSFLFPLLIGETDPVALTLFALPALGFYLYCWIVRYRHALGASKVLALDEMFVLQDLDVLQMRRCLQRPDHIWSRSLVREALQSAVSRPLPVFLTPRDRVERLRPHFHRVLGRLTPQVGGVEWIIPVVAAAKVLIISAQALPSNVPDVIVCLLAVAGFAASAGLQVRSVRQIRAGMEGLDELLAVWAEQARLYNAQFDVRKLQALVLVREANERLAERSAPSLPIHTAR